MASVRCKMGLHSWDNTCTCSCGATRDSNHKWNGCTCTICHKVRETHHDWNGCTCTICHKVRETHHNWVNCVCTHCGKDNHFWKITDVSTTHHEGSVETTTTTKCDRCGEIRTETTHSEAVTAPY